MEINGRLVIEKILNKLLDGRRSRRYPEQPHFVLVNNEVWFQTVRYMEQNEIAMGAPHPRVHGMRFYGSDHLDLEDIKFGYD